MLGHANGSRWLPSGIGSAVARGEIEHLIAGEIRIEGDREVQGQRVAATHDGASTSADRTLAVADARARRQYKSLKRSPRIACIIHQENRIRAGLEGDIAAAAAVDRAVNQHIFNA